MAAYTVVRAKTATLVASTVDTVTLSHPFGAVEVTNLDGAAEITFTTNGTTPTVDADDAYTLPAEISARVVAGGPVVKLISGGTPKYAVTGL